jgi:hypothetical protein
VNDPAMNAGRTVFAQLTDFLPRKAFDLAAARYRRCNRPVRLSARDQLLCMLFAQLSGRGSLRETVECLGALGRRRYHCGIRVAPARSTLARANERRDWRTFADTAMAMVAAAGLELPRDPDLKRLGIAAAYAIDSTVIDLCLSLFPWARFRRAKGGVKAHVVMDLNTQIPVFMRVTDARTADMTVLDQVPWRPGDVVVMDRGYMDFRRLYKIHQAGAFFVTRSRARLDAKVRRSTPPAGAGVRRDQWIRLRGPKTRGRYPEPLRRVRYVDPDTARRLTFLTNLGRPDAAAVALLYRKRWAIELLFKWMKGHLTIKAFFGTTSNAVKTQLWVAVIALVLVHRLKHALGLKPAAGRIAQVLSVALIEKTPIKTLFQDLEGRTDDSDDPNQLSLFEL